MEDVNILQHARGLVLNPASGQEVDSGLSTDCYYDHCGQYGVLYSSFGYRCGPGADS